MSDMPIPSSIGLSALKNEPQRLALEAERYNSDLEALVLENYRLFVKNLTSSGQLPNETIRRLSASMHADFDELTKQSSVFRDHVAEFMLFHKRNRKTLQRHLQLVELLEVPQLVDACARNGFHDEALELASFVNSLERKHILATEVQLDMQKQYSGSNSVIQSIVDDVQQTLLELRKQLFLSLTESCSLPRQLYYLGVLRKLDGLLIDRQLPAAWRDGGEEKSSALSTAQEYRSHIIKSTETRLQMDFLECRSIWLEKLSGSSGQALKSSWAQDGWDESYQSQNGTGSGKGDGLGHYGRAIELIEVNRTAWFEIITHFSALFEDTIGSVPSSSILSSWAWTQYGRFTGDLFAIVAKIEDGPSIRSILEQCLLFASRMSNLGCDFTEDIVAQFGGLVLKRFCGVCASSLDRFETMLLTERYVTESDGFRREHVVPIYLHNTDKAGDTNNGDDNSYYREENLPPQIIMSFPSLAHLTNGILSAINFIKDCPIIDIRESVITELMGLFASVVGLIDKETKRIAERGSKYSKIHYDKVTSNDLAEILSAVCLNEIFPHALRAFGNLYPITNTQDVPAAEGLSELQAVQDQLYKPVMKTASTAIRGTMTLKNQSSVATTISQKQSSTKESISLNKVEPSPVVE